MKIIGTSDWSKEDIELKSAGIIMAASDLELGCDVRLATGGIMLRGKNFFTYGEFQDLLEQDYIPDDWRLLTISEANKLISHYAGNDMTSKRFVEALCLGYEGYVYPRMADYNEVPAKFSYAIENRLLEGRYWVESPYDDSLYALWVHQNEFCRLYVC